MKLQPKLRQSIALLCTFAVLVTSAVAQTAQHVSPSTRTTQTPVSKRALTHQDYDSWRSILAQQVSRDGKFVAYAYVPQDGDGEIVARNIATGVDWRAPRGYRPPVPPPDDPGTNVAEFQAEQARLLRPVFTADSRFLVFGIEPAKAELAKAKKEKKKPEDMPKNALGIMDLATGTVTRIEKVKNFRVPEDGSGFISYLFEPTPEAKPAEKSADPAPRPSRAKKKEYGSELVLRNTTTGAERKFSDVLDYTISRDAKTLVFTTSARSEETNGAYAVKTDSVDGPPITLLTGKGKYQKLTWDEDNTQIAFISDKEDAAAKQPKFRVYHWNLKDPQATEIVSTTSAGFSKEMVVSERANLSFSLDGSRLFLGSAPPPEPEKSPDEEIPADEKVIVDLWHWKDDYVQPIQRVRAEQDRNRSYRAVYDLNAKKFVQLADETMENVSPSNDGRYAIGSDNRKYRVTSDYDPGFTDYYLINTADGSRKPLATKQRGGFSLSPNAKYALYFDGKDWNSYSVAEGTVTNLTKNLKVSFYNEEHDSPSMPGSYGVAGWTKDDSDVLIYDRYDIWQLAPDGSRAKNLTDGIGRKEKTVLRYVRLDPRERAIDPDKPMLLSAEQQETRDSGFYRDKVNGDALPQKLLMAAKDFNAPTKAKDADVLIMTASRFDQFPDVWVTNSSFREMKRVSNGDAQRASFVWGAAELVSFKNTDGVPLKGVLLKPENFDPRKKYPMIVYIYERLSQGLHQFRNPGPGTSINPTFYVSNGYLVYMPDIVYTIGYPGNSALKCVLPGIQAVVDKGFVNEEAIGIQGHSWGGYQIAYMVTQTNRFKAAAPGALVANMTSAYSGIRWGTGLPRQFQYERTQSRIGGSLWEYPLRFLENSPVFRADRVETPLLMLHNDEDDAVPWYQGIEYFLALRRLGKEAYMFNYNGEKHGLRKRINQKDYTRRLQEFFDHHLKGAPAAEWMEKGIPYLQREKEKEKYRASEEGDEP
ncbi:MAG TPA: prolyl oligopeptidase family serine peptidase [Pyrinomonadaceae bacterium]|nr:prolyl oligopeptidase family serine peptidase [Pyrinomonadaceae bacterium]